VDDVRTDRREQAGLIVHFKVNKIFKSFVPLNQLDNDVTISLMAYSRRSRHMSKNVDSRCRGDVRKVMQEMKK
jgi:hypothetical protein